MNNEQLEAQQLKSRWLGQVEELGRCNTAIKDCELHRNIWLQLKSELKEWEKLNLCPYCGLPIRSLWAHYADNLETCGKAHAVYLQGESCEL